MSLMSDILGYGLAALAGVTGDSLLVATTREGSYTALSGFVLHTDPVQPYVDTEQHIEQQEETATVKGPLTPVLAVGQFIKDARNGDRIWYIESVQTDNQQIARVRRFTQGRATPNRGAR